MSPNFRCFEESEDAVTYRAEVTGTPLAPPSQIISFIEEWLSQGALILFDIVLVPVDDSCQVVVSSIADPECNTPTTATTGIMTEATRPMTEATGLVTETTASSPVEQSGTLTAIVGGAAGVVIVLVVALIIVIVIILVVRAKRTGVFIVKNTRYAV